MFKSITEGDPLLEVSCFIDVNVIYKPITVTHSLAFDKTTRHTVWPKAHIKLSTVMFSDMLIGLYPRVIGNSKERPKTIR